LAIYLFLLEKNAKIDLLETLISDVCGLAVKAFDSKLDVWIANVLVKKIEGRFDIHKNIRKRALKTSGSSIYFIN